MREKIAHTMVRSEIWICRVIEDGKDARRHLCEHEILQAIIIFATFSSRFFILLYPKFGADGGKWEKRLHGHQSLRNGQENLFETSIGSWEKLTNQFITHATRLQAARQVCLIVRSIDMLANFPWVEIDPDVDYDSRRAVYFRQMRYGLFVSVSLSS